MDKFLEYIRSKIGEESCPITEIKKSVDWLEIRLADGTLLILTQWVDR